jgi:hypothetical protein
MYFNILVVTIILCVVLYMSECVEDVDVVQDSGEFEFTFVKISKHWHTVYSLSCRWTV